MGLELRGGVTYTRLNQQDVYLPFAGLSLVGALDEPPPRADLSASGS